METKDLLDKPNLSRRLFWEYRYDSIDWNAEAIGIIERVIERGTESEWLELIRFYGQQRVVETLKYDTTYLPDETIEKVCRYFDLKPEELKCYVRKQSLPRHWI